MLAQDEEGQNSGTWGKGKKLSVSVLIDQQEQAVQQITYEAKNGNLESLRLTCHG